MERKRLLPSPAPYPQSCIECSYMSRKAMNFFSGRRGKQSSPSISWKLYILLSPNTLFITWMVSENTVSVQLLLRSMTVKFQMCFSPFSSPSISKPFPYYYYYIFFQAFSMPRFPQHWGHAISLSRETLLQWGFADNCLSWIDCKYWTVQIFTVGLITPVSLTLWTHAAWTR